MFEIYRTIKHEGGFMKEQSPDMIRRLVREHYGKVAKRSVCGCSAGAENGCCAPGSQISASMGKALGYSDADLSGVVESANMNLGCGNPLAIGKLHPGETVLDLGCGGGFDSFLAAKAVGPEGRIIGVDMTPEMVSKARENAKTMKVANVSFRLGEIEHLPVADAGIDVILSNCVINLSPDKPRVWREAYRVLRPGGRLAISDVVATAELPEGLRKKAFLLTGCVTGAENVDRLKVQLTESGFENIHIRIRPQSQEFIRQWFPNSGVEQYVASADVEAKKPLSSELNLPRGVDWIQQVRRKAEQNMGRYDNCTQSIVAAFLDVLGLDDRWVLRGSSGFFGGMLSSLTCGVHSAGVIVMGLIMGRERLEDGLDGLFPIVPLTQELIQRLNIRLGSHSCRDLTGVDFTDLNQALEFHASEGHKACIARVADGAEEIAKLISEKLAEGDVFRPKMNRHP
jgi:ubiquinone/menaquinone biosynthesis C-methylase UbiE